MKTDDSSYSGVDAVVDKDRTAFKLGQLLNADYLLILTDVEKVYINFNTPDKTKAKSNRTRGDFRQLLVASNFSILFLHGDLNRPMREHVFVPRKT